MFVGFLEIDCFSDNLSYLRFEPVPKHSEVGLRRYWGGHGSPSLWHERIYLQATIRT